MDWQDVDVRIADLDRAVEAAESGGARFHDLWAEVRAINEALKIVRYPTRQEREAARSRHQAVVERLKEVQATASEARAQRSGQSQRIAKDILAHAEEVRSRIRPGVLSVPSPNDVRHARDELDLCWQLFGESKDALLAGDRRCVWEALSNLKTELREVGDALQAERASRSSAHLDRILYHAHGARPAGGVIGDFLGGFTRDELNGLNGELRSGWEYFKANKHEMTREDQNAAWQELKSAEADLNAAWDAFKASRNRSR